MFKLQYLATTLKRYFITVCKARRPPPWPASRTRQWPSPPQGNTSSAPRGSGSCRCRWGTGGGSPEVPELRGQTDSPEAPTAAVRWSSGPACSGTACVPTGHRCSGSLRKEGGKGFYVIVDQDFQLSLLTETCFHCFYLFGIK